MIANTCLVRSIGLTVALSMVTLAAAPVAVADEKPKQPQRAYEPTSNYEIVGIEGWKVYVNKRLRDPKSVVGRKAIRLLRVQLYQISTFMNETVLAELRKVPIWLDDDPKNRIHYHPEKQWLIDNGFNPDRAQAVDIGRVDRFVKVYRDQPFVVLHELAHAYHDRVLGFNDERIRAAYEKARGQKNYDSVLKIQGRHGRHYALSNHKEYFAEATEAFFGTNDFYPFVRAELQRHDPRMYQLLTEIWQTHVVSLSHAKKTAGRFGLDGFYKKLVSASGFPIVSSEKVADAALLEAAYLINRMLDGRQDIREALIANRTRFVVMSRTEFTTDIPEYADMKPKNYWDRRARGLGATPQRPAVSCGEENLLRFPGDPYHKENILVHEFAHAIHHMGLNTIDKQFDSKLKSIYDQAMQQGLWKGKYAATNRAEYWAEGVQSYFGTNRPPDHDHNHVDTRGELKEYDRRLFALIDGVFGGNGWQYQHPEKRSSQVHLKNLDVDGFPTFAWPQRLAEESAKLEALKKAKQQPAVERKTKATPRE